jgi:hypothetical protein
MAGVAAGDCDIKITDYVSNPRISGYRGNHIIWRYKSDNEQAACYDNMRIEIQIRTELQHSWATAVEVCSTFTDQNLKSDHPQVRDEWWVRFFALMGSVMANKEGGGLVKDTPTRRSDLMDELGRLVDALKVSEVMKRRSRATDISDAASETKAHQFLIELQAFDHLSCRVNVTAYAEGCEQQASEDRVRKEIESRKKMGVQVALVGVQSVEKLKIAYQNYFSDTTNFLNILDVELHGRRSEPFTTSIV